MTKYTKTFNINVAGERTQESFFGDFEVKTMPSFQDQLTEDRIRRELVSGPGQIGSSANGATIASVFATLHSRVVKAPTWWTESNQGLDLLDTNVVKAVYDATIKAEEEQVQELKDKAEAARKALAEKPLIEKD